MSTTAPDSTPRSGVPLGGLGCGKIEFCPDGAFRNLTTHNNLDQPFSRVVNDGPRLTRFENDPTPEGLPDAFLFCAAAGKGACALKSDAPSPVKTLDRDQISFLGLFPRAELECEALPTLGIRVDAFSPLIPEAGPAQDSTLPAAIFRITLTNKGNQPETVCAGMSWPNVIGCGGYPRCALADLRENYTRTADFPGLTGVRFLHKHPKVDARLNGEYLLATDQPDASWAIGSWSETLWSHLGTHARLPGSADGGALGQEGAIAPGTTGMLAITRDLAPGDSATVSLVLSWYFPRKTANLKPDIVYTNAYAGFYPSAEAVTRHALSEQDRLFAATRAWQDRLRDSSLPEPLVYKLINNLAPMSTGSMYLSDGRFSINEAPTDMNGCMGTIDQRTASASAYVMLFPDIAKSEIMQFANQQIHADHPQRHGMHWNQSTGHFDAPLDRLGAIKHELGWDELEEGKYGGELWCNLHWPDLSAVFVLQCTQQILWTGDREFLHAVWPKIQRALDFLQRLDQNGDGLPDLWGPGSSTFDNEQFPYYGACTFISGLALAALKAGILLAEEMDDSKTAANYQKRFARAQASVETILWSEERGQYLNWADADHRNWDNTPRAHAATSENSMLSQLAGCWAAQMLGLGDILDPERVRRSLLTLYERNVAPFDFCAPNEVKPDGTHSWSWPCYGESYFAANCLYHGLEAEGMEMVEKFRHTAFDLNPSHWDLPLSFEGEDNSIPKWGRWYMTTPSSWTLLNALAGIRWNALTGELTIRPANWPEMPRFERFPLFLPGALILLDWDGITLRLTGNRGELNLAQLRIPDTITSLTFNGKPVGEVKDPGRVHLGVPFSVGDVLTGQ